MGSGTTPNWALPYPLETDVPDAAADMHALALALDNFTKRLSGVAASRPSAASGLTDVIYYATDTHAFSVCDGSAWHQVVIGGADGLATRSASSSLTANIGDYIVAGSGVTITLPSPTAADQLVGIIPSSTVTGASPVTVTAGSNAIYGPGLSASSFLLGSGAAGVILRSLSTSQWLMVSGQQDTGWVALTLNSGITVASSYEAPAVRLQGDRVWMSGGAAAGTLQTIPFTLPTFAVPNHPVNVPVVVSASLAVGSIAASSSSFSLSMSGSATPAVLEGVSYRVN
jgi:hypothetical protein